MGSSKDFADYVCDQVRDAGDIAVRKMFGEYALYCDGKVVALICDDQVFVKKSQAAAALLGGDAEEGFPYPGAKPYFLLGTIDDRQFMARLIRGICDELPEPKAKKRHRETRMAKQAHPRVRSTPAGKNAGGTADKSKRRSSTTSSAEAPGQAPCGTHPSPLAREFLREFTSRRDAHQAAYLQRFFKTGPGQYGEGDRFLGLKVPATRTIIKPFKGKLTLADYAALLASEWHEVRLGALLLMGDQAKAFARKGNVAALRELVEFYDRHLERANNWDLVDMSVRDIMAAYWQTARPPAGEIRKFLQAWADSGNLWRERAAIIATYARLRMGSLDETFWLAERFLQHPHDLLHKACGWMLREAGTYDIEALRAFLAKFHRRLPRTALRYAIEHMDAAERKQWMKKERT